MTKKMKAALSLCEAMALSGFTGLMIVGNLRALDYFSDDELNEILAETLRTYPGIDTDRQANAALPGNPWETSKR